MKTHFMLQLTAGTVHQRELAINQLFILFCVVEVFMNNSVLAGWNTAVEIDIDGVEK